MKTLVIPSSLEIINKLNCDGVILGIKDLSVNMPFYIDIDDIQNIENKEIFIALNKNMHNCDLKLLKETLIKLNDYNIKGVIYYDISIVNYYQELDLNYDLVWNQEHMTNNYYTTNFWYENGVKYTWVSNDITLREMHEIRENTKAKLMVTLFGYLPIFDSRRHLVKNYLKTFSISSDNELNYMSKEGKTYPLVDDKQGTTCYSDFILNGLSEKLLLNYDYIVLNSFLIDDEKFISVLDIFNTVNKDNVKEKEEEINEMFSNTKKGFFYEETVYKVK